MCSGASTFLTIIIFQRPQSSAYETANVADGYALIITLRRHNKRVNIFLFFTSFFGKNYTK